MNDEEQRQAILEAEWDAAIYLARQGDNSQLINVLRKLDAELVVLGRIPDLSFIADVLEGKFKPQHGRPAKNKIARGLKNQRIANAVFEIADTKGISIENAIAEVAQLSNMSESSVKKHYQAAAKLNRFKSVHKKQTKLD